MEKQQHIEQPLNERNLERTEISQADEMDEEEQQVCEFSKFLEDQLQEHMVQLAQLKESRHELATQLEKHQKKNEEAENLKKEQHDALEGDSATTTVQIKSLQDDSDQIRQELDEESEMLNVLKQEISSMQAERDSLNKKIELKLTELSEAEEKLRLQRQIALQKEMDTLKMALGEVKSELETSRAQLEAKNQEQVQYQSHLRYLESKLEQSEEVKKDLSEKLSKKEAEAAELHKLNALNEVADEEFVKRLENFKLSSEELEGKLQSEADLVNAEGLKTKEDVIQLCKELCAKTKECNTLTWELNNLKTNYADVVAQRDKAHAELQEKSESVEKLKIELLGQKSDFETIINAQKEMIEESIPLEISTIEETAATLYSLKAELEMLETGYACELEDMKSGIHNAIEQKRIDSDIIDNLNAEVFKINLLNKDLNSTIAELREQLEKQKHKFETELGAKSKLIETILTEFRKCDEIQQEMINNYWKQIDATQCKPKDLDSLSQALPKVKEQSEEKPALATEKVKTLECSKNLPKNTTANKDSKPTKLKAQLTKVQNTAAVHGTSSDNVIKRWPAATRVMFRYWLDQKMCRKQRVFRAT